MIRNISPARFLGAVLAVIALSGANGCYYSQVKAVSTRPVEGGMEVIVHSAIERHLMDTIGVFPFDSPPETNGVSEKVTAAYEAQLIRMRPFREVRPIRYAVKSDAEALWYGRNAGCDLVMASSISYAMDGSGTMPTRLTIRNRILDARTGMVLWDIKQKAFSNPGADIDLCWTTVSGQPAQRLEELGDTLARQFAGLLVRPLENEKEKKERKAVPQGFAIQ
ncbi:MAG: hypothetical protein WAW37_17430 [Syntrophobacteraceae bacterium]